MTQPAQSHQALYRRWRAQTFGQIVGQEPVVETLRNAVRSNRVAHALLFVGPRGTGKTSMARIVAKALNCTDLRDGEPCDRCEACVAIREGRALDVIEMDAASNNKVDDIRDFLPRVATVPSDLAAQGVHRRRGPADQGGLGPAPQDPRGTAGPRRVHLLHDRRKPGPAGGPVAGPAVRLPAAAGAPDRRQAAARPRGRGTRRPTTTR